jgi:hypothetical protein
MVAGARNHLLSGFGRVMSPTCARDCGASHGMASAVETTKLYGMHAFGQKRRFGRYVLPEFHLGLASSERPRNGLQFEGDRRAYVLEVVREALMLRKHFLH